MFFKGKKKINHVAVLSGIALTATVSSPMITQAATEREVHLKDDSTGLLAARSGEVKEVVLPSVPKYAPDLTTLKNVKFYETKEHVSPSAELGNFYKKGNYIFVVHSNNTLEAFDNRTGKSLWKVENVVGQEITVVKDLLVLHNGVEVAAYDMKTGEEKWHKEYQFLASTPDEERFFIRGVFSSGEHLYYLAAIGGILENKNAVYVVDTETGNEEKVYEVDGIGFSELQGATKNTIKKSKNALYYNPTFDLIRFANNGVQYSYILKPEKGFVVTFIPTEDKVYLITRDYENTQISHFYILEADTGKVLESYKVNDEIKQLVEGEGYIDLVGNGIYRFEIKNWL